jgi:hypothetical protein
MAFEEHPELIEPRVGDDVDEHAAAHEMNADRQAIGEVLDGASLSLADADVRQIRLLDPRQRQEGRRLLIGGPELHQIGSLDDGVEHHQPLNRVVQSDGLAQAAVGLTNRRV